MTGARGKAKTAKEDIVNEEALSEPENAKLTLAQKKRLKKKQREAAKKIERYVSIDYFLEFQCSCYPIFSMS
jgi:hypothetical protein